MILENWSVVSVDPYAPPEFGVSVSGQVYGSAKWLDGDKITTSTIVKIDGSVITTYSGSIYTLGQPCPKYVEWCKKNNCYVPTPDVPIREIKCQNS